jgi:glycogen synthase
VTRKDGLQILIVGDFPPPHGGVAVHVEVLQRAVRAHGGICRVLDIGKGQLPADGVVPAGAYAFFAAALGRYALRGYRIHVHTSGANPKSWLLAASCAAAGRVARVPPFITFHSGLAPGWLAEDALRSRVAGAVGNAFGVVIAVSDQIRAALVSCGVSRERVEVVQAFSRRYLEPGTPPPGFAELRAEAAPLYCAMLAPGAVYGAEPLLRAFARVHAAAPQARLALYGPGTARMHDDVVRRCGPACRAVKTFGELHRPEALALVAQSDVFVRPTLADGDSVSLREAVALGRPVVATAVGTRPPEARLVAPDDAEALANALLAAGRERPPLRLAAEPEVDCVDRLLELYGGPPSPAPEKVAHEPVAAPVEAPACAASAAS